MVVLIGGFKLLLARGGLEIPLNPPLETKGEVALAGGRVCLLF